MTDTVEQAAAVMRQHYLTGELDADRNERCACGRWAEGPMEPGWDDHLAQELAAAGLLVPVADDATIERVARAIGTADGSTWDELADWYQDECRTQARAAIAALTEES